MKKHSAKEEYSQRLHQLVEAGIALSSEKEIHRLLELILENAISIMQAEAAHIYLLREKATQKTGNVISLQKTSLLYFLRSYHLLDGFKEHDNPLSIDEHSFAGYAAKTQTSLNIKDCQNLPPQASYQSNPNYDGVRSHKVKSLLTVPMLTADGKLRGVIQLVNKLSVRGQEKLSYQKRILDKHIVSFNDEDVEIMQAFASYAAISLENSQLTESIENLFESFVRASVKAIEARDPTTSGHSDRVAMMTVELALATHKIKEGPYKSVNFSEEQIKEIRYASLLHDFGKIGVTEPVLLKKKKLKDRDLESILLRFDSMAYTEESIVWKTLCEKLIENQKRPGIPFDPDLAYQNTVKQIEMLKYRIKKMRSNVISANEPQVLSEDFDINELIEKLERSNEFFNNSVLTQDELKTLSIPRGSLTPVERQEIESHVSHTYNFLKQIAWTDNLSHVTTIAHCHHEKMDGTGYPRGIKAEEIPIQSRMMTIADIYDALTAFDRPYKKSLSEARALEILIKDARAGKIDGYLLKIFIEAGIFHHATLGTIKQTG
jgi:HD-GYP domain-containing protein (c-di-GMP phosphodiesterase class II)